MYFKTYTTHDPSLVLDLTNNWSTSTPCAIEECMRSTTMQVIAYFDHLPFLLHIFKRENNISFLRVSLQDRLKGYLKTFSIQTLIGIFHQPYCKITKLWVSISLYSVQDDQMESFIRSTIARPVLRTLSWDGVVSLKMMTELVKEIPTAPVFRKLIITNYRADFRPLLDVAHYLHVLDVRKNDSIGSSDAPDLWAGERRDCRLVELRTTRHDAFEFDDPSMYFTTTFHRMHLHKDETSLWIYRNSAFHFFYIPMAGRNEWFRVWAQGRLFLHMHTNTTQHRLYKTLAKKFLPSETQQVMICTKLDRWVWNRPCRALGYDIPITSLSIEFSVFL